MENLNNMANPIVRLLFLKESWCRSNNCAISSTDYFCVAMAS
jgi:hypothetical protein